MKVDGAALSVVTLLAAMEEEADDVFHTSFNVCSTVPGPTRKGGLEPRIAGDPRSTALLSPPA